MLLEVWSLSLGATTSMTGNVLPQLEGGVAVMGGLECVCWGMMGHGLCFHLQGLCCSAAGFLLRQLCFAILMLFQREIASHMPVHSQTVTYRYGKCMFSVYRCWGLASLVMTLGFLPPALLDGLCYNGKISCG